MTQKSELPPASASAPDIDVIPRLMLGWRPRAISEGLRPCPGSDGGPTAKMQLHGRIPAEKREEPPGRIGASRVDPTESTPAESAPTESTPTESTPTDL